MKNSVYLMVNVLLSVIDNLVVGQLAYTFLWPLALYPLESLLTANIVAAHDSLEAHFQRGGYHDDAVDDAVGS